MAGPAEGPEGQADARRERQVAQRVFAAEFNDAKHHVKEDGTYGPSYVVSPFGAKVNRLFAVGVLTSVEGVGQTGDRYRAAVVDPTGTFTLFAGQYEPEATAQLMDIRPPAVVAIVGKSRAYTTQEGATYVNIRPESIRTVEKADRDAWVVETARHSMLRLEAIKEVSQMEPPTAKALEDLGFPKDVAEGTLRAIEHYGKADLQRYAAIIRDALESLAPGASERVGAEPEFAAAAPAAATAAAAPRASASAAIAPAKAVPKAAAPAENPNEPLILSLAEKMDDGKGAPWEDIVSEAAKKGVSEASVEECLNALMDKGLIYEPVLGRLKRT